MLGYSRFVAALATFLVGAIAPASLAAEFLIDSSTGSPSNRQSFDPTSDRWLLDVNDFVIDGPLVFASDVGGDPGLQGSYLDDPSTFSSVANVIVLRNFDNNDVNGFPANWDNSFNARRSLEIIANNTEGDRPGFYLYWNEALGVNRLVYTQNLNDGTAPLQVLFAVNSANLISNSDNLQLTTTFRGEANANFNSLVNFSAANFQAVPEAGSVMLMTVACGSTLVLLQSRRWLVSKQ